MEKFKEYKNKKNLKWSIMNLVVLVSIFKRLHTPGCQEIYEALQEECLEAMKC
jgi:hypothetical protein